MSIDTSTWKMSQHFFWGGGGYVLCLVTVCINCICEINDSMNLKNQVFIVYKHKD